MELIHIASVYCISHIQNAQLHNHRACWACPFCELACLGICKWWRWLLLGIFAEVARFWPLYIALVMGAYSKAESALLFFPLVIESVQTPRLQCSLDVASCTQHKSLHSSLFLTKFSGPGRKGLATFFPPTSATLFASLLLHSFLSVD